MWGAGGFYNKIYECINWMYWCRPGKEGRSTGAGPPEHSPAATPSRAVYGFFLFLFSNSCLLFYLVWAVLPDPVLEQLGLDFFPQKYWAVAGPLFLSVLFFIFVVLVYPLLGLVAAGPDTIEDKHSVYEDGLRSDSVEGCIPPLFDIPYGQWSKRNKD